MIGPTDPSGRPRIPIDFGPMDAPQGRDGPLAAPPRGSIPWGGTWMAAPIGGLARAVRMGGPFFGVSCLALGSCARDVPSRSFQTSAATTLFQPASSPEIFWASEPVAPDDTALIVGSGLSRVSQIELVASGDEKRTVMQVQPTGRSETSVTFVVPPKAPRGTLHYTLFREGSPPLTGLLNGPKLHWVQGLPGHALVPGEPARAFGKGFTEARGAAEYRLLFFGGPKNFEVSAQAHQFHAQFTVPSDIPEGTYDLVLDVEERDEHLRSDPLRIQIQRRKTLPTTHFDVTTFGADRLGKRSSSDALERALGAARKNGGGVVYFPRGRFLLDRGVELPAGILLKGKGRELTSLYFPALKAPPPSLVSGPGHFAIEDLGIYATNHHLMVSSAVEGPQAGHVRIRRVRIEGSALRGHFDGSQLAERAAAISRTSEGLDALRLGGPDIEVSDSVIQGTSRPIAFLNARGALVQNNVLVTGALGWYSFSGSDGLIVDGNTITGGDLLGSGGGLNCLYGTSYSQNVYFHNNTFSRIYGWDREAFTSDGGGGAYDGPLSRIDGVHVELPSPLDRSSGRTWIGGGLYVTSGKGRGQLRRVEAIDGTRVTLTEPFGVTPDNTSRVSLTTVHARYIIADNRFQDTGLAVQFYGSSWDMTVWQNQSERTAGFHNIGMRYAGGMQPSWFVQWIGNRIDVGNAYRPLENPDFLGGEAHIGVFAAANPGDLAEGFTLGAVVRRNILRNNSQIVVGGMVAGGEGGRPVEDVVIEHNHVEDGDEGIRVHTNANRVVLRDNRVEPMGERGPQ